MPSERPNADEYIEFPDTDRPAGSQSECDICGSTDSLSEYSFGPSADEESTVVLCSTHYQVAAILNDSSYQDSNISLDYDLQETRKITVRVPRALIESADSVAEQQGQTRSELVRDSIQMAITLQDVDEAFDEILSQAVQSPAETDSHSAQPKADTVSEADVEFLKERIRTLESLLEDSIEKI